MEKTRTERAIEYITKLFQGNGDGHDLSTVCEYIKMRCRLLKRKGREMRK